MGSKKKDEWVEITHGVKVRKSLLEQMQRLREVNEKHKDKSQLPKPPASRSTRDGDPKGGK